MRFYFLIFLPFFLKNCSPLKKDSFVLKIKERSYKTSEIKKLLGIKLKNYSPLSKKNLPLKKIKQDLIQDLFVENFLNDFTKKNNFSKKKDFLFFKDLIFLKHSERILKKELERKNAHELILQSMTIKKISPEEILNFYNKNKNLFLKKPACLFEQILLPSQGKANLIKKKLERGESFKNLSKIHSSKPLKIPWIEIGTLDIFDWACNNLDTDKSSPVLKSNYGFHILKLKKRRKGGKISFQKAEKKIANILKRRKQEEALFFLIQKDLEKNPILINKQIFDQIKIHHRSKYY